MLSIEKTIDSQFKLIEIFSITYFSRSAFQKTSQRQLCYV